MVGCSLQIRREVDWWESPVSLQATDSACRSTRGRGEVLGQAGVAEACAYTLEGVSKNQKKVR